MIQKDFYLRRLDILGNFLSFYEGHNGLLSFTISPFWKKKKKKKKKKNSKNGSTLKGKNLLPRGANSFL